MGSFSWERKQAMKIFSFSLNFIAFTLKKSGDFAAVASLTAKHSHSLRSENDSSSWDQTINI